MSTKTYYHNIDLASVGQLTHARRHNISTADRTTLAGTLGASNEGLFVWDTDIKAGFTWDGSAFVQEAVQLEGDVIFKGVISDLSDPSNVNAVAGYQYVIGTAGTLTITGVTFSPTADVQIGDIVLFTSSTAAYVLQGNDVQATESVLGNVKLASQSQVNTGTDAVTAVTPATLQGKLVAQGYTKQYSAEVDVVANTPLTINHALNLANRDAFVINCMVGNSQVSFDVDSTDANNLTLTSLVSVNDVRVTVVGASAS